MLDQKQIDTFFDYGILILENLFEKEEITKLINCSDEIYKTAKTLNETCIHNNSRFVFMGENLHRVVWCGAQEKALLDVSRDPKILGPVSQLLYSNEMDQLINQLHFKMPGDQVHFPLHQDCENRGLGTESWSDLNNKGSYVQTLLALDEMNENNGPLLFLPNSPKLGPLNLKTKADHIIDETKLIQLHLSPGSLALFGPLVVHGSLPNNSNLPRRVLINGYAYPNANKKVYPGCGTGERIVYSK